MDCRIVNVVSRDGAFQSIGQRASFLLVDELMYEKPKLKHEDITDRVIRAFYDTYNELAGFPEFVVRRALVVAIEETGMSVEEEKPLPVWFKGRRLVTFRADLVVASAVIVEVKTRPEIDAFHKVQLLHYLKATDLEVGLLVNFGRRPEFHRVVYDHTRKRPRFAVPENET
jgi:GxxExxY protein